MVKNYDFGFYHRGSPRFMTGSVGFPNCDGS
jgi:hypothetical protein